MADYPARLEKRCKADLEGERVLAATLAHPPGSSLYSVGMRKRQSAAAAGVLGSVLKGKAGQGELEGEAATLGKKMGVMALTEKRLLWFAARVGLSIGPQPTKLVRAWPHYEVAGLEFDPSGQRYPMFALSFPDGSAIPLMSEKGHKPERLYEAWQHLGLGGE